MKKCEILSPAGDLERLKWAIRYGADAVYIGGYDYSLRANANNFRKYTMSDEMAEDIVYFDYNMSSEKEKQIKEGYRGTRLRKKYEYIYASDNKVLVKMSSTPGEIDCISALVDEESNYPSHSFFALISKDKRLSNYVLCALINSKIINQHSSPCY